MTPDQQNLPPSPGEGAIERIARHPQQRTEVAAAVIERPDGTFLMASRPEGKVYAGWWEFPGGKVEPGESARHALDRELREELGIDVVQAYPWINRAYDYEHARVMLRFFRVTEWQGEPHPHEGQGGLAWTHAAHPEVEPILPANGPILRALQLPLTYAISAASELGVEVFLERLDVALAGGLRLVQVREKALAPDDLSALATQVQARCQAAGATLIVNADVALAARLGAGVHLSAGKLRALDARPDLPWVSASCHDAEELALAERLGADFVVLSPVLPTASHPGAAHLGWPRFRELIADYPLPVYALGGLHAGDMVLARGGGAHGIALKSAAWAVQP
jgi:8-oxo-dGTP diphosphatase